VSGVLSDWIGGVQRLIPAFSGSPNLESLRQDEENLSLLYLCNAAEFTEARRTLRLQGPRRGLEKIKMLVEKHRSFLQGLSREMTGVR
jgi:hypothetical protein